MLRAVIKALILAVCLGMLLLTLVFFTREATKTNNYRTTGMAESSVQLVEDSVLVFTLVDERDFLHDPFPIRNDTILSIADSSATWQLWNQYFDNPQPVGEIIPLTFRHENRTINSAIKLRAVELADYISLIVLQGLRFLIALGFVSVGLWAFLKRPDSAGVRTLAMFCMAMTSFMITSVTVISNGFAGFDIPYWSIIRTFSGILTMLLGAFWLNLQLLFPRPNKFIRKWPRTAYGLCYGPLAVLLITRAVLSALGTNPIWPSATGAAVLVAQILIGLSILIYRHFKTTVLVEKRQIKLVMWGSGGGLIALLLLVLLAAVFTEWFEADQLRTVVIICFVFASLLVSPASFAYAFGRYGLLDVVGRFKRGTRYFMVTIAMLAAFLLIVYATGELLLRNLGIESRTPTLAVALILAMGFMPLQRKLQSLLSSKFYPERARIREMIGEFLDRPFAVGDKEKFWGDLEVRLREGLMVEAVYPVLRAAGDGHFAHCDRDRTPFTAESRFLQHLQSERRPILVDEAMASRRVRLNSEEGAWLLERRVAVVLPMIWQSKLTGFLGLGFKTDREDYTSEDLQILSSLASQVAVASENIRLLEENVEKRRLEEDMQTARRIQEGFLPQRIPDTPGLEVAAHSRFCLEVAGDYYDVIRLDNSRTLLAVGDVSGKGAGAALLMANLQASLRTSVGVGVPLTKIVTRINELIYRNTPPEQYITFFVGMYDPDTCALTYVNAGHNPPIVMRSDGSWSGLGATGLILGSLSDQVYEQETVRIGGGDVLLMYTDGLTEAMNGEEEEFGEERLIEILQTNGSASAEEMVQRLEIEVKNFRSSEMLDDDCTLLVVRAIAGQSGCKSCEPLETINTNA